MKGLWTYGFKRSLVKLLVLLPVLVVVLAWAGPQGPAHAGRRGELALQRQLPSPDIFQRAFIVEKSGVPKFSDFVGAKNINTADSPLAQDYAPPKIDEQSLQYAPLEGVDLQEALKRPPKNEAKTVADRVKESWSEEGSVEVTVSVPKNGVQGEEIETKKYKLCKKGTLYSYAYLTVPEWPGNLAPLKDKDVRILAPVTSMTSPFALVPILDKEEGKQYYLRIRSFEGWNEIVNKLAKIRPDQSRYNELREALVIFLSNIMAMNDAMSSDDLAGNIRGVSAPSFSPHGGDMVAGGLGAMSSSLFVNVPPGMFEKHVKNCTTDAFAGDTPEAQTSRYRCFAEGIVKTIEQLAQDDPHNPQYTVDVGKILVAKTCTELLRQTPREFGFKLVRVGGQWSVSGDFAHGMFKPFKGQAVRGFLEPPANGGRSMLLDIRDAGYLMLNNVVACTELLMGNLTADRAPGSGDIFTTPNNNLIASADQAEGLTDFQKDMFVKSLLVGPAIKLDKPNFLGWAAAVSKRAWADLVDVYTARTTLDQILRSGTKKLAEIISSEHTRGGLYRAPAPNGANSGVPAWAQPGMSVAVPVKCVCGGDPNSLDAAIKSALLGALGTLTGYGLGWSCTLEAGFLALTSSSLPGAVINPALDVNNMTLRSLQNTRRVGDPLSLDYTEFGCALGKWPSCAKNTDDQESKSSISQEEMSAWLATYKYAFPTVIFQRVSFDMCAPKIKNADKLPYGVTPRFWSEGCRKNAVRAPVYSFDSSMSLYSLANVYSRAPNGFGFDPKDAVDVSEVRFAIFALFNNVDAGELTFALKDGFVSVDFQSKLGKMLLRYLDYLKDERWNYAYMCEVAGPVCDIPLKVEKNMDKLGGFFKHGEGIRRINSHDVTREFPSENTQKED